jgi:hypothetical protein
MHQVTETAAKEAELPKGAGLLACLCWSRGVTIQPSTRASSAALCQTEGLNLLPRDLAEMKRAHDL